MTRDERQLRDLQERLRGIEATVIAYYPLSWAYDGSNLPLMIDNIIRYYQGRLDICKSALEPFAQMDRPGCDLDEVACVRGTSSDMTLLTSQAFRYAREVLEDV